MSKLRHHVKRHPGGKLISHVILHLLVMIRHEELKQLQHITEMEFTLRVVVVTIVLKDLEDEKILLGIFLLV